MVDITIKSIDNLIDEIRKLRNIYGIEGKRTGDGILNLQYIGGI